MANPLDCEGCGAGDVSPLPPLPHNLQILQATVFCGDVIAISTEDGFTPGWPFILMDGRSEWQRLLVN